MPRGWQWDDTLFAGSAPYYSRGRLPYPPTLAAALASLLSLDGRGRLLDVGCGPGTVALQLAHLFEEVVGLDPDAAMLAEAERQAAAQGSGPCRWVQLRAEDLPAELGPFRVATFAQSFHWMDRGRVAAAVFALLESGGAFVQISTAAAAGVTAATDPPPPRDAIAALRAAYLGPARRAGQGVLRHGTPAGEDAVVRAAGFGPLETAHLVGGRPVLRSIDDLIAAEFSTSGSAPHLFGERLAAYQSELRALLHAAAPAGRFTE